jgi:hypothetical protein
VFVERQGDGQVIELLRGEPRSETRNPAALGLAANAERLFVGYAQVPIGLIDSTYYDPPGRLLAIDRQSGRSEVLLESEDHWMAPVAADAERVIVFALSNENESAGFYRVPLAAPRLEPLPLASRWTENADRVELAYDAFVFGQLAGGEMYWQSGRRYPVRLLRAGFDDPEPEELSFLPTFPYAAGAGQILTQELVFTAGDRGAQFEGFDLVLQSDSGCRSIQGPRDVSAQDMAIDGDHAYWTGQTSRRFAPAADNITLTHVDLKSGSLLQFNLLGFTPSDKLSIVGQDDSRLYLYDSGTLLSLQKP